MTNRHVGEVEIKLLGRPVTLRPSFANLAAAEEKIGLDLVPLAHRFAAKRVGLRQVAALIDCCWASPDKPSAADVGELVVRTGLAGLIEPVGELLLAALNGGAEKKDAGPTGAAPATTEIP